MTTIDEIEYQLRDATGRVSELSHDLAIAHAERCEKISDDNQRKYEEIIDLHARVIEKDNLIKRTNERRIHEQLDTIQELNSVVIKQATLVNDIRGIVKRMPVTVRSIWMQQISTLIDEFLNIDEESVNPHSTNLNEPEMHRLIVEVPDVDHVRPVAEIISHIVGESLGTSYRFQIGFATPGDEDVPSDKHVSKVTNRMVSKLKEHGFIVVDGDEDD